MPIKTVFLSSTSKDLEAYRKAAIDVCMRLGLHPIAMEYFNAMSAGATEGSKRKLDEADLYVGFFAHRYGYIEDGYTASVTEIEFDYATERGLDQICFIVDPKHPWPEDTMDHENNAKLVAFKNKVNKLIRGQFTTVDKFESLLTASLVEWLGGQQERPISSSSSSAVFATRPDKLKEKPKVFIGREQLFNDVYALLEQQQQVLLQGFGSMGKTALAAALAARWLENHKEDDKGGVLWLKAGSAEVDALFESLARPFKLEKAIASQTGDAKIDAVNDLLHDCGATLLVLDDCWSGKDLFALLEAVPDHLPVLMTARQRYPIEGEFRHVDELSDADALALLTQHAHNRPSTASTETQNLTPAPSTGRVGEGLLAGEGSELDLCHLLGNHAFAIEIAGKTLKAHNWTPADLITKIKDTPHDMTMPLELSQTGRENVANLLEVSLNALDDTARNTFLAFGAFFAPQLTPEMLQLYFENDPVPPSPCNGEGVRGWGEFAPRQPPPARPRRTPPRHRHQHHRLPRPRPCLQLRPRPEHRRPASARP